MEHALSEDLNIRQPLEAVLSPGGPVIEGRFQAAHEQAVSVVDPSRPRTCFSVQCLPLSARGTHDPMKQQY